jgi:HD-GYP domain-containing protein (c-di-GMP phosphodiesterase class II)
LRAGIALEAQTRLALEDLADVIDLRDHYTFEHSRRVAELARLTARRLRLEPGLVELITTAGRMHDLGKIGVRSSVLMKPGALTPAEWQEMRAHPDVGARLLGRFPTFARGQALVRAHHERFDGTGYPLGLRGEQIPLGARVITVADAWDALTSPRAYRAAMDLDDARAVMKGGRGTQFDPVILDSFLSVLDERPDLALAARAVQQAVDPGPATVTATGVPAMSGRAP